MAYFLNIYTTNVPNNGINFRFQKRIESIGDSNCQGMSTFGTSYNRGRSIERVVGIAGGDNGCDANDQGRK